VGVIIMVGVLLIPWFFFLLNLQALLGNLDPANRRMSPGKVWLNFIPVFHLGWFIYTVIKVRESLEAEFGTREWFVDGDLGYNVGLTAGILWIASFFIGWIPFFGWVLALGGVICWVIYWLRVADLKNRLDPRPAWSPAHDHAMYGPGHSPYVVRYPRDYVLPGTAPAASADHGAGDPAADEQPGEGDAPKPERRRGDRRRRDRRRRSRRSEQAEATDQTPTEGGELLCKECGADYELGDWFCRKCGSRLV
jgi:hypothetical protein